jgi:hypothetical protein
MALGAAVLPAAGSAATSYVTPAGGGVVTEIILANGGYSKCLNDYGQNVSTGAAVRLYTCVNASANQWVTFPDNTIRPYLDPTMALDVVNNHTVLEPANGTHPPSQQWYFMADGTIVSGLGTAGGAHYVLNDPGFNASNGVQLIVWNQSSVTDNAHWWAPSARYGNGGHGSTLTNRPDSGGQGNWANDNIGRESLVIYMGDATPGTHTYQGSVVDNGSFTALAGDFTPNQGATCCSNEKLGDSLGGSLYGLTAYSFTTDQWVSSGPSASYSGAAVGPTITSNWYQLFFQGTKTTFGGTGELSTGPNDWAWAYTSAPDRCGSVEHWLDAQFDNSGQTSTTTIANNIVAPAACV